MAKLSVEQALLRAETHLRNGEHDSARALYDAVLAEFPTDVRVHYGLARLNAAKSKVSVRVSPLQEKIDTLIILYDAGQFHELVAQAQAFVAEYSSSFVGWNILAGGQKALGRLSEAEKGFRKSAELNPGYAQAYNNLGITLHEQGKLNEAIAAYRRALGINPAYAQACSNMGVTLHMQGKLDEAIATYRRALEINPVYAQSYYNMGNVLKEQGKLNEAIAAYHRAVEIKPIYAEVYNNMGVILHEQGKLEKAIVSYRRAIGINPVYAEAYNNMGNVLKEQVKLDDAMSAYHRSLEIKPVYADAYNNMGNMLHAQGKLVEAIASYRRALEINPVYAEAYNNMGNVLKEQGKLDDAISAYRRAVEINPTYALAEAQLLHQRQHICDFTVAEKLSAASGRLGVKTEAVPPFAALSWDDNPRLHQLRAINWAREMYKQPPLPIPRRPKTRPKRLKIGYFGADFHDHAVMQLVAGMFEQHHREEFEIFAFSFGPYILDEMRRRVSSVFDKFIDVEGKSTSEIVELAGREKIDIAVDLNGYTKNMRTYIFEGRVAPIQINYLGYPGSMGVDFIDYIIADPVVIPPGQRQFYSEKVVYLPHSYLPNDNKKLIAATNTTRSDVNLPEDSFVFCCFNNNYKISPSEFGIWMRLLNAVEGSVLWLRGSNKWAESNLHAAAAERGIDPSRLVFAPKMPHSEHLARHKHADLFIDTFNFNAHTTASDALWSGLPVVTKQGKKFAARVAASLLTGVGLPELITNTEEEYEQLILELARDEEKLNLIKAKLAENRLKMPLFDTERYTRNFEKGLMAVYNRYFDGLPPEDIWLTEKTSSPHIIQCAPMARFTSGGRIHPDNCR